jgi:hypothetical protein
MRMRQPGNPKMLEKFQHFILQFFCQELPAPAIICTPSTSTPTPSPSSSPTEVEGLQDENHRLRLKLQSTKKILQEKKEF